MTKDEALKLAKVCIQASLEYKRGNATAVEAVEDIDAMLAQPDEAVKQGRRMSKQGLTEAFRELSVQPTCKNDELKKPWVSLTKEEIDSALSKYQNWYEFAAHLENILKEKNQ